MRSVCSHIYHTLYILEVRKINVNSIATRNEVEVPDG